MPREKFRTFVQQPIAELIQEEKQANELVELIETESSVPIYIGSTTADEYDTCVHNHEAAGFVGTFYYFKSDNMRMRETTLLNTLRESTRRHYNLHDESSDDEGVAGYVYVIVGYCHNSTRPIYQYYNNMEELIATLNLH
jgi:hypothetical protein